MEIQRKMLFNLFFCGIIDMLRKDLFSPLNLIYINDLDQSSAKANYLLQSEPRCLHQMCSVYLKYNRTLETTRRTVCLSICGQPRSNILATGSHRNMQETNGKVTGFCRNASEIAGSGSSIPMGIFRIFFR